MICNDEVGHLVPKLCVVLTERERREDKIVKKVVLAVDDEERDEQVYK